MIPRRKIEHNANQSRMNRTFENKNHVNETKQNKITTSGLPEVSTLKISKLNGKKANDKMDREIFYHWGLPEKSWTSSSEEITAPKQEATRYPGQEH